MGLDAKYVERTQKRRAEASVEDRTIEALEQIADSLEFIKLEMATLNQNLSVVARKVR